MIRFGAFLPGFGYPAISMDFLKEAAQEAEALGYESLQLPDHPIYTEGLAAFGQKGLYDPIVAMSQLAAVTRRIKVGTAVLLVPLQNPFLLAKAISTLDQASGGRVELGVGIGAYEPDYKATNVPYRTRGRAFDEILDLLVRLWTEDEVTHRGEFFQMDKVTLEPKPVQKPHPGLWFGGGVRKTWERAARLGVGWGPWAPTLEHMAEGIGAIREMAKTAGRDLSNFRFICEAWTAVDYDIKRAEDAVRPALAYFQKHHAMDVGMDFMHENSFIGPPEKIADRMQEFVEVGVNEFHFACCPWERCREGMRLVAEKVLPRFR
ncbi:MAG: LLM class flavin-dependent oxidoreductase [Candidatus Tectomicrobia bacterium]|nr:LLM class flavin-dependent oxidoreductase [Candidatus Tectomicrobia bacterium]